MPGRLLPVRLRTYRAFSHQEAINAARADLGEQMRVVQTRTVRRSGLFGFLMSPIIELTIEMLDPEPAAASSSPVSSVGLSVEMPAGDEPELDMDLERAKTQRLAQALAIKLEKESAGRAHAARNERMVEQAANFQRSLDERAERSIDEDVHRIVAPAEQVARRFTLVPESQSSPQAVERQALLEDSIELKPAEPASPTAVSDPDPIRQAVHQAVQEEALGIGEFGERGPSEPELIRKVYARLIEQEVTRELADQLIAEIIEEVGPARICDLHAVQGAAERRVAALLPIDEQPLDCDTIRACDSPYVVAMIGPTGVGKTTTIAKLAAACRFRDGLSVGLITTDSFRMAAVDQLRSYADILKIPLEVVIEPEEMHGAIDRLSGCDVILVDSAGRSRRDRERLGQLRAFLDAARPQETHLVLSTTSGERTMMRDADAFACLGADRVVLTKLDESDGFGVVLNVIQRLGTRISFVTTGQEVPDDIEQGGADRIARMLLAGIATELPSTVQDPFENEVLR